MGDVLRRTGTNYVLLFPDDRTNTTLNSSTPGDNGIATTNFEGMLFEDGEVVATNLTALATAPYLMTIDNVSGTFGTYKVNITLPERATYDLFIRHTADIVTVRQEQFDTTTRPELMSLSQGNTRYDFTIAGVNIPARQVAAGVLDQITVTHYADGAAVGPTAITSTQTYEFTYGNLGDTNPSAVIPT
jgi:endoglucanase Acf2